MNHRYTSIELFKRHRYHNTYHIRKTYLHNKSHNTGGQQKQPSTKLSNASIYEAPKIFNTVLNAISTKIGFDCQESINQVTEFHNNLIKNHQVVEGTARYNMIRLYCIKLLEGQNPEPLVRVAVGKKDRWPSAFDKLRPLFYRVRDEQCQIADRVIRSILYLNRLCKGNSVIDLKEIEKTFIVSNEVREEYRAFLKRKTEVYTGELISKPSTRVLSKGPNGKPKWQTADLEAYALIRTSLHEHFKELCVSTGNLDLYNYMLSRSEELTRSDRKRLRYITSVPDKGNKCRLVAISDYWTQVLLEPIMLDIKDYTKQRFGMCSYGDDQPKGFEMLKKHIRPGIRSYDVSSWTDAFPASLQLDFMTARYGRRIALAWYNLVVDCCWNVKGTKSETKYGRGQGMGTAGSFDIATITDLFYLEMVMEKSYNISRLSESLLGKVGDDLWIYDPSGHIYNSYTKDLGIDINESKSKQATEYNLCGEFVSRSINYGVEVSRISANICRAVERNILDLAQLAYHLESRGYESMIPIRDIFKILKIRGRHKRNVVRALYLLCLLHPRQGLDLLKNSLEDQVWDLIADDYPLTVFRVLGTAALKRTYEAYSIGILLNSIISKLEKIVDATVEYDSSAALEADSEYNKFWELRGSIELITSKVIMSRSWKAVNEYMRRLVEAERLLQDSNCSSDAVILDTDRILSVLEDTDQRVTFKELGVISDGKVQWRPRASRLFNLVSQLRQLEEGCNGNIFETIAYRGLESRFLTADIYMPDGTSLLNEPTFGKALSNLPHLISR